VEGSTLLYILMPTVIPLGLAVLLAAPYIAARDVRHAEERSPAPPAGTGTEMGIGTGIGEAAETAGTLPAVPAQAAAEVVADPAGPPRPGRLRG
jgi:hypothetical protein